MQVTQDSRLDDGSLTQKARLGPGDRRRAGQWPSAASRQRRRLRRADSDGGLLPRRLIQNLTSESFFRRARRAGVTVNAPAAIMVNLLSLAPA